MKRLVLVISLILNGAAMAQTPQWTAEAANDWYSRLPWLVGSNYTQSNTVNQLEMWQAETFDSERIDMELGWAENLGFNVLRVFLNDQIWHKDTSGCQKRMGNLLKLADKHKMRVIFVLFNSSGDPYPQLGRQHQPKPGVRQSLWAQSPSGKALTDRTAMELALEYAKEVVAAFSIDKRILAWDVWNEPDNANVGRFGTYEPVNKAELVRNMLPKAFEYARAGTPTQPLTSGLWRGDWSSPDKLTPIEKIQVELSDFLSFQNYAGPEEFGKRVKWLQAYGRPVICTGFLARNQGSTPEAILPIAQKNDVGVFVSDLVAGKNQTWLPWDSWERAYTDRQPEVWPQDIFRGNGAPYKAEEVKYIRDFLAANIKPVPKKK